MKTHSCFLSAILAMATPATAVPLMVSNMKGFQSTPVVDVSGMPLDAFDPVIVAVGTFASAPAGPLSPGGALGGGQWAALLAEFTAFGPQRTLTEPRAPLNLLGVFDFQHDGVVTGTPLAGKPVYVVLAKGSSLATAVEVCILKTTATFEAADDENPLPKRVGVGLALGTTVIAGSSSIHMAAASNLDPSLGPAYTLAEIANSPEIAVETPATGDLVNGSGMVNFGVVTVGFPADITFTIRNTGGGDLHLTGTPPVTFAGADAARFSVVNGPGTVIASSGQTTFTVRYTPVPGPAAVASMSIANDDSDENPFVIQLSGSNVWPEIVVESPAGTDLQDGAATLSFGPVRIGRSATPQTVTVKNSGTAALTGLGVTLDGVDFTHDATALPDVLAPGGSGSFEVNFVAAGTVSGDRSAIIRISSSDWDEASFEIQTEGLALSPSADGDGDGLNDWAEHRYSLLGFNWQVPQLGLVGTLQSGANAAGLYTPAQVQALHAGAPLISRDPLTGTFKLTMDWKKSTDLQNFADFPALPAGVSVNAQGDIVFEFTSPDPAAFFRIEVK